MCITLEKRLQNWLILMLLIESILKLFSTQTKMLWTTGWNKAEA